MIIIEFSYDDSTSLSASSRSRNFWIFGLSREPVDALGLAVLLLENDVAWDDTFVTIGFFAMFEVSNGEFARLDDDELTDIFNCNPVCWIGADFDCLLLTETCELRVDWFPIVTSSRWLLLSSDFIMRLVGDCCCVDCLEEISTFDPPI